MAGSGSDRGALEPFGALVLDADAVPRSDLKVLSIRGRLWNIARAELLAARRRITDHGLADRWRDATQSFRDTFGRDDDESEPESRTWSYRRPERSVDPKIRRYYANLELPVGASLDEVKAAYRRLVRAYHPDHHGGDPAAQRVTMELRTAYEGLKAHLETRTSR